jgi:hypothetical protein
MPLEFEPALLWEDLIRPVGQPIRPWRAALLADAAEALADAAEVLAPAPPPDREKNDKPLWDKLLSAVKEIYEPEYVCVAGGAIRDYLIGKDPKDIDIFVKLPEGNFKVADMLENAQCLGWKHVAQAGFGAYNENKHQRLVFKAKVFGRDIDLIFVVPQKTGREIVDTFDFTICQHWYDGEVNSLPEAKYAIQKKLWTPVKGLKLDNILREHYNRVNKRHGGIYKLDEGEPWYNKFAEKAKIR